MHAIDPLAGAPGVLATVPVDPARTGFARAWTVEPAALPDVARRFVEAGRYLEMLTCLDLRATDGVMRLVYTFNRFDAPARERLHADLPGDAGWSAPSLAGVTPAADWMEREVWDMYGVTFAGHPDLRRILLPDDADFHALQKDFGRIEDAPAPAPAPAPAADGADGATDAPRGGEGGA